MSLASQFEAILKLIPDYESEEGAELDDASEEVGLGPSIVEIVRSMNRPMVKAEIFELLQRSGFRWTGKTDPSSRLSTELYRLSNKNLIKKIGSDRYTRA